MDLEPFLRLLAAAAFAGAIGLDRELRAKPAGLRTNIVVGVAAAAFGYVSVTAFEVVPGHDPSRVASTVVTGIGFLGGGAIFAAGGKPHGLTTAAALWGSAAAGLAAGVGSLATGLALVFVTLVALWPLDWLSDTLLRNRRRTDVKLDLVVRDLETAGVVRDDLRLAGVRLDQLAMAPFGDQVSMTMVVHGRAALLTELRRSLRAIEGVHFLSEESVLTDEE